MPSLRGLWWQSILVAVALVVGCSGEKRPAMALVSGVITYKEAPVEGAIVRFTSESAPRGASGTTDASGKYRLTTFENSDGAVLGDHRVTIIKIDPAAKTEPAMKTVEVGGGAGPGEGPQPSGAGAVKVTTTLPTANAANPGIVMPGSGAPTATAGPPSLLPAKYANPTSSGFTAKVVAGKENKFDFTLTD